MFANMKELLSMSRDLKLLYVEDDPNAFTTTLNLLNNFFENIVTAVDGEDALEKFNAEKFDLILSDISMPNLNGIDMLKKIRETDKDIAVIFLSAHSDSKYFLDAIDLNIDSYITKPIKHDQVLNALYKVTQKIHLLKMSDNYQSHLESEVQKRNQFIEHKLHYDSVTEMYSRYSFFNDLETVSSPTVFLVDIDKFRVVNEVYGSSIGSKVLASFAKELNDLIAGSTYNIYRLSSDEFAILDKNTNKDTNYKSFIDLLVTNLNSLKLSVDGYTITVDVSIGISIGNENPYESARTALEYSKDYSKRYTYYSDEINHKKESQHILDVRDEIISAIDENRVVTVYQPIVDVSGKVIKSESLMRLRDRDSKKLISPFHFLDVSIKTKLYDKLSENVIFTSLHYLANTKDVLSINFTYSDIKNIELVDRIEEFLNLHVEVGSRCVFELTENESIENYSDVKSFILRFKKYGVKVAIDDFGTGFSNFEHILEIEPDYLKIDGSLVKDIDTNNRSFTLVEAIVGFSHKLGIKVIAEFVHSKTIFEMLKELNVDEYQGYYFSEPLENIGNV
ncbi:EAL domain-containing protein [Sulfurimonas sp.]|nr:EAL domain-containing protein [Sulfurimonas sp.]